MSEQFAPIPQGLVILGHIARAHGVHGAVVIVPYTESPERILAGHPELVLLSPDSQSQKPLTVVKGKEATQGLIVKIKGVTSRDEAALLRGWRVVLPREFLPEPAEDEIYLSDLVGLTTWTVDGTKVGEVTGHLETGASILLVIVNEDGRETLIPFQDEFVVEVDLEENRLLIDPPPDLLEL